MSDHEFCDDHERCDDTIATQRALIADLVGALEPLLKVALDLGGRTAALEDEGLIDDARAALAKAAKEAE